MITHLAKETRQQKEQWGWGSEVTGKWGVEGGQNLEKGGWQYKGGLHQTGGLARLYHLRKETLKISHSLHY